jgi:transcriptional regulator with XRE-family HTH domain
MTSIGKLIKEKRTAREWGVRQLATELGVTGAYVMDLEADRRLPSPELRERISAILGIPLEDLAAGDSRLSPELRTWIEDRPDLGGLLRSLRASPESDLLIQRFSRFIKRRVKPPVVPKGFLITWESELRAMAAESAAWSIETGGDLFGRWQDVPILFLATKAGPQAQRDHAHFRLDVDYLRHLSEVLASEWGLRYFGDWHSHHRLGLSSPSSGDRRRIVGIAKKNQFLAMAEIIVTLEDVKGEPNVRVHPWRYDIAAGEDVPAPLMIKVFPGISPVREALLARQTLPEQELYSWERASFSKIRISAEAAAPAMESIRDVDNVTREKALSHLMSALQDASGAPIENHSAGFGSILVARIDEPWFFAVAIASAWPMTVLEVHLLNRETGTTDPFTVSSQLTALSIKQILDIYRAAKEKGRTSVDN